MQELIEKVKTILQKCDDKAHDANHAERVANDSILLGKSLSYPNLQLLELCGWWHDAGRTIQDSKHEIISAKMLDVKVLFF